MSLLLDALKKAAKDKAAKNATTNVPALAAHSAVKKEDEFEFTLDDNNTASDISTPEASPWPPEKTPDDNELAINEIRPTPNTVSDEALQVLIYKTNNAHRRKRWLVWGGATVASVLVLTVSGVYFFNKIQQQVTTLELRHRANMRVVQAEPVKAALAKLSPEVQSTPAVKTINTVVTPRKSVTANASQAADSVIAPQSIAQQDRTASQIKVTRSEKSDPVGALLLQAWSAYNSSDYEQARKYYAQVLNHEINNRDALMGMGAIALNNDDSGAARQYYNRLLQLDPHDPVANAAMMNMNLNSTADSLSENKLLHLIRQNPAAADLHYALGNKYAAQSRWSEAQVEYFKAFKHDSASADYAFNLAVSLEHIKRPLEAVSYYRRALQLAVGSNIGFSVEVANSRLRHLQAVIQP